MERENRIGLINRIQEKRGSVVISYITGDRPKLQSEISEDAVRVLHEHLLRLNGNVNKIDLFVYSRGGDVSVPWRIVSMFREYCENFCILIPYKAHSATTMITLGADEICMGKKAELGPIDPALLILGEGVSKRVSVEDVTSYISFMKERANISDQAGLATIANELSKDLTPLILGTVYRTYSHIRLVARKLLSSRKERLEETKIDSIVEALTEKIYFHGHAIARKEAKDLYLPVITIDEELEKTMWDLYKEYEIMLNLTEPFDPEQTLRQDNTEEKIENDVPVAVVESLEKLNVYKINILYKFKRKMPPNLQLGLNLSLPPGIDPQQLSQHQNQSLTQLMNSLSPLIMEQIKQEISRQAPIEGIDVRQYGGKWYDIV